MTTDMLVRPHILWGAKEIGAFAGGVSAVTVYSWERLPDCPVTKVNGRYCVDASLLLAWLTRKIPR
jgi:hypothetical protein